MSHVSKSVSTFLASQGGALSDRATPKGSRHTPTNRHQRQGPPLATVARMFPRDLRPATLRTHRHQAHARKSHSHGVWAQPFQKRGEGSSIPQSLCTGLICAQSNRAHSSITTPQQHVLIAARHIISNLLSVLAALCWCPAQWDRPQPF